MGTLIKAKENFQISKELLANKVYDVKDTGEAARNIHHWKNEGLLLNNDNLKVDLKNKKLLFNLTEYFWIKTIQQFRRYGLSIKDIKKIKLDIEKYISNSFTQNNEKIILEVITKKVNEELKDESEEFRRGAISQALKNAKEMNPKSGIESIIESIINHRSESGLFIKKDLNELHTIVYIKVDGITDSVAGTFMSTSHFYISFDEIFFELGISDHFKHSEILSQDERNTIKEYSNFLNSKNVKSVTSVNNKGKIETKVKLKHINDPKEIEMYKMKYGEDFSWRSKKHNGKSNFFDFRIDIKHRKQ